MSDSCPPRRHRPTSQPEPGAHRNDIAASWLQKRDYSVCLSQWLHSAGGRLCIFPALPPDCRCWPPKFVPEIAWTPFHARHTVKHGRLHWRCALLCRSFVGMLDISSHVVIIATG
jgi:hypothetical protein